MTDTMTTTETTTMPMSTELDTWKVDFTWKKLKFLITDSKTDKLIMRGDCAKIMNPLIKFLGPDNELIGTASFHLFSIHAKCEVRGRAKQIKAMKHWTTEYTYLSDAFSNGGLPAAMYWTSSSGFKHWDFILLDSNKEPVARFRANVWAVTKLGLIEFMGNYDQRAKEEIAITGSTVYYNMIQRMNNIFQIAGAIGSKTGPLDPNSNDGNVQMEAVSTKNADAYADPDPVKASQSNVVR